MKKLLLFILLFSFISICYSQPTNVNQHVQIKKELTDSISLLKKRINALENKIELSDSISNYHFITLTKSIDSIKVNIDDNRLRESLKSAEAIINKQNSLIDGFSDIFNILTIFLGLVTLGIPILIYFLTIRPANKALKKAKQKFDLKINNYTVEQIDEAINNLKSKNHLLVNNSLNHILSIIPKDIFSEQQLYKIYSLARYEINEQTTKESLVFMLSNYNFPFCKAYFFELIKEPVDSLENNNLKNYAFNYLIKFHKNEKYLLAQLNQLIMNCKKKKESILILLDLLVPDNLEIIWTLLNFEPLIRQLNVNDMNYVYEKVRERDYMIQDLSVEPYKEGKLNILKVKLSETLLGRKILEMNSDCSKSD